MEDKNTTIDLQLQIGLDSIDCIIADREFIGQEWFRFTINSPIKFYLRIRENLAVFTKDEN